MAHAHAVRVHECGGPDALTWESMNVADPGPGEVLVRTRAAGLNFIDTYYRTGFYKAVLPFVVGSEGVGVVEAIGPDVTGFALGDRVGYVDPIGSYAELLIRPAARLVKIPGGIGDAEAAAILLKGMTAEYLLRRTHKVTPDETILVHAAAGGTGQLLCQWASGIGATVIGTVGNRDKADAAKAAGCAHVIVNSEEDFAARVKEITVGRKVPVVYDGIGADTFRGSLNCLAPFGLMVSFGASSGPVPPLDIGLLTAKGSLFLTRPGLFNYIASTQQLQESAAALFDAIQRGLIKVTVNQTYALKDAAKAHADLESRKLTGSTVLLP